MSFDPQTNWSKTEILRSGNSSTVQAADGQVEVVDSFVYFGSRIDSPAWQRGSVEDRHCSDLCESAGKTDLEVKHQARYQDMAV